MTVITKKPENPIAHLTARGHRGASAASSTRSARRSSTAAARTTRPTSARSSTCSASSSWAAARVLLFSSFPPAWLVGTAGLSVAKILENMEIGHNILHGQWDWMRDPKIHSTTWEWDNASPAESGSTRTTSCTTPTRTSSARTTTSATASCASTRTSAGTRSTSRQPLWNFINACFFEYGIAAYDLELGKNLREPEGEAQRAVQDRRRARRCSKIRKQATKDYVVHPALSSRPASFLPTLAANFTANLVRNLWSHSVIMCGHFPEGVETFEKTSIEGETRGEWYLRQMLGSANISGGKAMHIMTGNLSHQIEHHLFPDLPSNRYAEIAPQVQDAVRQVRPELPHRPLPKQVSSAWHKVIRLSLPNGWLATTNAKNLPEQTKLLWAMTTKGPKVRRAATARLQQQARKQAAAA